MSNKVANTAATIGIVAAVVSAGAVAYFSTRNTPSQPDPQTTPQVQQETTEDPAETAASENVKTKRRMFSPSMLSGEEEMSDFKIPTREEIEEQVDQMLAEYRKMTDEQKAKIAQFAAMAPLMIAMQMNEMKKRIAEMKTEEREKALQQMDKVKPVMEEFISVAESRFTAEETKTFTPLIALGRRTMDTIQLEFASPGSTGATPEPEVKPEDLAAMMMETEEAF